MRRIGRTFAYFGTKNGEIMIPDWKKEFAAAITICDKEGVILEMNDKAGEVFKNEGGTKLIGQNLFNCHLPASAEKIKYQMDEKKSNTYTIEKNGVKKLIYQSPWYENGEVKGLVEFSVELPEGMPHFIRS